MATRDVVTQGAALLAMTAAVAAVLWLQGDPVHGGLANTPSVDAHWAEVETGADHIEAVELAQRMLKKQERIAIVDVRPSAEFAQFHLRGAVSMSVPELVGEKGESVFAGDPDLVVLCSNGPAHPAQAWVELRRQGRSNVRVLDGGLDEMKRAVFTPPTLAADVDEATAAVRRPFVELARKALIAKEGDAEIASAWCSDPPRLVEPSLVSPAWVASRLDEVVVVDVRSRTDFEALHAPRSAHVTVSALRERHGDRDLMLLPAERLAETFSQLGIGMDTQVAIVADRMHDAAFAALAFLRTGHRAVAVVEGGIAAWARGGHPLVAEVATREPVQHGVVASADDFTITVDQLAERVRDGRPVVLDSRPRAQFSGEEGQEARRGHVPGAANRPLAADLDASGRLLDRASLEAAYASLGADVGAESVAMCRTGHQAAQTFFVLRFLLGRTNVKWCNGSFTIWAERTDLPVVTGDA